MNEWDEKNSAAAEANQKFAAYSQLGAISEPALSGLREQIKKIMIPMLIKIFHLKLELSQATSPPSRLQNSKPTTPPEELLCQLKSLDEDLHLLIQWCSNCRNQIGKALDTEEETKTPLTTNAAQKDINPSVAKSFSNALSSQSASLQDKKIEVDASFESTPVEEKSDWRKKILKLFSAQKK